MNYKLVFVFSTASVLVQSSAYAFHGTTHQEITAKVAGYLGYDDPQTKALVAGNLGTDSGDWAVAKLRYEGTPVENIDAKLWNQAKTTTDGALKGLYGTNFLHFDHESFANGSAALRARLKLIMKALAAGKRGDALWYMGSSLHSIQDFFAHSNYVEKYSAATAGYKQALATITSTKLANYSSVKRYEDLFELKGADPKVKCAAGAVPTKGALTSGYWPDNVAAPGKCHHADMAKDDLGGEYHKAAVGAAKLFCYDFLLRVEGKIKEAYPANAQAWINYLKGKTARVGDAVDARWGQADVMRSGAVDAVYGRLALVRLEGGKDIVWVEATSTKPKTEAKPQPSETNEFSKDDRVAAPYSTRARFYPGKVTEKYGKLVRIQFDDGDRGWSTASRVYPIAEYLSCVSKSTAQACDQKFGLLNKPKGEENGASGPSIGDRGANP